MFRVAAALRFAVLDWLVPRLSGEVMSVQNEKLGPIAGNGKFPLLVLDAARAQGYEVVVAAIREEASAEMQIMARRRCTLAVARRVVEADRDFSTSGCWTRGDGGTGRSTSRFFRASARTGGWRSCCSPWGRGTQISLLGAVAKVLADEGITLETSTGCWNRCW